MNTFSPFHDSSAFSEERARLAIESAMLGTFDIDLVTNTLVASERLCQIFDLDTNPPERSDFINRIHPDDRAIRDQAYQIALQTGQLTYMVRVVWRDGSIHWIDVKGKYFYNESNAPLRLIGIVNDITAQKRLSDTLAEKERKFRNTVQQAPAGMAILRGRSFTFEVVNQACLQLIDKTEPEIIGKNLFEVLPEIREAVEPLLYGVMDSDTPMIANEFHTVLNRGGRKESCYFNVVFQALKEEGRNVGVVVVANEVTDLVKARHALEETQQQFFELVTHSPIAMTIWRGPDLVIEMANDTMFKKIWRKEPNEVIGKKALDVFPELRTQRFPELLKKVYETGTSYRENEALAFIGSHDGLRKFYLDFEYAPLLEPDGNVSGVMITVYDVTEKVESRLKLIDAESRMRLAVEGTDLSTWDLNLQSREIIHSPWLAVIFGHPETRVLLHSEMRAQIHPEDRKNIVEPAFEAALKTGFYHYEARIIRPDRSVRWIHTRGKVFYDEHNVPQRMLGTLTDITDSRLVDEQSSRLAAIVESSDDAIISKQLDGTITSWNKGAERVFGYQPHEIIGKSILCLIPPDRLDEETAIISRLVRGERVDHIETKRLTKDGRLIELSLTISPIRDQSGRIIGASKIARDITRQKKVEREMRENEERLQTVIEASALGTWEVDLLTNSLSYSNRYLRILGFREGDTPSHAEVLKCLHPDDMPVRDQAFKKALETGKLLYAARLIWPDGSIRWVEGRGNVFFNDAGKPVKATGTLRDITEEKTFSQALESMVRERTHELQQANIELEKMNQELASFAYVSSHDLQEPLRKIQAFSSRIVEKEYESLSPAGRDYFTRIQEAARRMQLLIQDLLAYSRTNRKEKEFIKTDLNVLLAGVLEDLDQTIQEKKATVTFSKLPELSVIPFQFRQLFTNLLSNSLKFRKEQEPLKVDITADVVTGEAAGSSKLNPEMTYHRITFCDNGIGFENEYSERIFEVFQRLHTRYEYEGTGIGLAICKKIVENHQGVITAYGQLKKGATFTIYLPAV